MDNFKILLLSFCVIGISYSSHQNIHKPQSSDEENSTLIAIIENILISYFSEKSVFISMILSPTLNENLLHKIFQRSFLNEFSYNILEKLDTRINTPRNVINLIIVDDFEWFP